MLCFCFVIVGGRRLEDGAGKGGRRGKREKKEKVRGGRDRSTRDGH